MKFLRNKQNNIFFSIFLLLIFSKTYLSANLTIEDVGRVYVRVENQSGAFLKGEVRRKGGRGTEDSTSANFSLANGDFAEFPLNSLFRKKWRSDLLFPTKWNIEFCINFCDVNSKNLFEFIWSTKIEERAFYLKQETISMGFSLNDAEKNAIVAQDALYKFFLNQVDIYFVNIIITQQKPIVHVDQKVLKLGDDLFDFKL